MYCGPTQEHEASGNISKSPWHTLLSALGWPSDGAVLAQMDRYFLQVFRNDTWISGEQKPTCRLWAQRARSIKGSSFFRLWSLVLSSSPSRLGCPIHVPLTLCLHLSCSPYHKGATQCYQEPPKLLTPHWSGSTSSSISSSLGPDISGLLQPDVCYPVAVADGVSSGPAPEGGGSDCPDPRGSRPHGCPQPKEACD